MKLAGKPGISDFGVRFESQAPIHGRLPDLANSDSRPRKRRVVCSSPSPNFKTATSFWNQTTPNPLWETIPAIRFDHPGSLYADSSKSTHIHLHLSPCHVVSGVVWRWRRRYKTGQIWPSAETESPAGISDTAA